MQKPGHQTMEQWDVELESAIADSTARWLRASVAPESAHTQWAWHGSLGNEHAWPPPRCVSHSVLKARPGYDSTDASEYLDSPTVLDAKISLLANLIRASRHFSVYTGAGLSTSAGIGDYASQAATTMAKRWQGNDSTRAAHLRSKQPTLAHLVLSALARPECQPCHRETACAAPLKAWVNQNHDGLGLKATCPPRVMNEIHGSWFDTRNAVVQMRGSLRPDLCRRMESTARVSDLVLAGGTSLCGLYADQVATDVAHRHWQQQQHASAGAVGSAAAGVGHVHAREAPAAVLGLVIVNLQKTMQDVRRDTVQPHAGDSRPAPNCVLRIFATLDVALGLLARKLCITLPTLRELKLAAASCDSSDVTHGWYAYMYECRNLSTTRETEEEMRRRCGYPRKLQPRVRQGAAALARAMTGLDRSQCDPQDTAASHTATAT